MTVFSIRIEEEMIKKIDKIAKLRGISRSAFVREALKKAIQEYSKDVIEEACFAMRRGKKPHSKVNWKEIEKRLSETEPYFISVEEALAYSRRRDPFEKKNKSGN